MRYQIFTLRDNENPGPRILLKTIENNRVLIEDQGNQIFGVFVSLLGLATNEAYLITFGEDDIQLKPSRHLEIISCRSFRPTVRPTEHVTASEPGVYVFRWSSVDPDTVDEITSLSAAAWPDFESSFETRVHGLFAADTEAPNTMLLITWYRDLTVWEQSRHPPPSARENFLQRHKLTLNALPVATSLASTAESKLVSHS